MQLSSMKIRYFRCFDELEINFQTRDPKAEKTSPMDGLTVLVGRNGEGKTAVLDAINIAWNPFFWCFPECRQNGFKKSDRPSRPYATAEGSFESELPYVEAIFGTKLLLRHREVFFEQFKHCVEAIFGTKLPLRPKLNFESEGLTSVISEREACFSNSKFRTKTADKELSEVGKFLMRRGKNNDQIRWPLLAYYGDGRLWGDERSESAQHKEATLSQEREYAYDESTNPKSGFKEFARWFVELSHALANKKVIYSQSSIDFYNILNEAVQDSLSEVLKPTGWTKIACDDNDRIIAFNGDNIPVEVACLSAGTRVVLGLVADIVFRCCKLNRRLRENVLKETPGIVLIDEIELHLHPSWQQEILPILCKIFPRIQFIVTTHSPQVVSSVPAECIRILDQGKVLSSDIATEGARAEQVLNDVFGTDSRAKNEVSEKLSEYRGLINDGKWDSEEALRLKRFLHERLGSDPYLARLEIEARLKESQRRRANETR